MWRSRRRFCNYFHLPFYKPPFKKNLRVKNFLKLSQRDLKIIPQDQEIKSDIEQRHIQNKKQIIEKLIEKVDIIKYAIDTVHKQGYSSLYSGIISSIFGSMVQNGTYFFMTKLTIYVLDYLKIKIHPLVQSMLINFIAAVFTATITNPIWVLNARMAKKNINVKYFIEIVNLQERDLGNIDMIKKIISEEGFSGFLKGMVPSLILTLVPVIQFTSYELLKKSMSDAKGNISNKNVVLISFFSKFISILLNYPLMTLKTLYQSNSSLSNKEIIDILNKVFKEEGIIGFYKGLGSKVLGSVLNNMILMLTYERLQNIVRLILTRLILGKSPSKIQV